MDAVLQFFIERWPAITIVIVAIVAAVWVAVRVTKRVDRTNYLEERCKDMPCDAHTADLNSHKSLIERLGDGLDRFEGRVEKVEELLQDVHDNVLAIQTYLQTKYKAASQVFSQKHSPRQLNDMGRKVFEQFGGGEFLDANEDMLVEKMASKAPKTALDVEQDALEVLYETLDSEIYNSIKLKVYNSSDIKIMNDGKEENYSITMDDICFIFSLELRDRYLEKHPEVPQKEE